MIISNRRERQFYSYPFLSFDRSSSFFPFFFFAHIILCSLVFHFHFEKDELNQEPCKLRL